MTIDELKRRVLGSYDQANDCPVPPDLFVPWALADDLESWMCRQLLTVADLWPISDRINRWLKGDRHGDRKQISDHALRVSQVFSEHALVAGESHRDVTLYWKTMATKFAAQATWLVISLPDDVSERLVSIRLENPAWLVERVLEVIKYISLAVAWTLPFRPEKADLWKSALDVEFSKTCPLWTAAHEERLKREIWGQVSEDRRRTGAARFVEARETTRSLEEDFQRSFSDIDGRLLNREQWERDRRPCDLDYP